MSYQKVVEINGEKRVIVGSSKEAVEAAIRFYKEGGRKDYVEYLGEVKRGGSSGTSSPSKTSVSRSSGSKTIRLGNLITSTSADVVESGGKKYVIIKGEGLTPIQEKALKEGALIYHAESDSLFKLEGTIPKEAKNIRIQKGEEGLKILYETIEERTLPQGEPPKAPRSPEEAVNIPKSSEVKPPPAPPGLPRSPEEAVNIPKEGEGSVYMEFPFPQFVPYELEPTPKGSSFTEKLIGLEEKAEKTASDRVPPVEFLIGAGVGVGEIAFSPVVALEQFAKKPSFETLKELGLAPIEWGKSLPERFLTGSIFEKGKVTGEVFGAGLLSKATPKLGGTTKTGFDLFAGLSRTRKPEVVLESTQKSGLGKIFGVSSSKIKILQEDLISRVIGEEEVLKESYSLESYSIPRGSEPPVKGAPETPEVSGIGGGKTPDLQIPDIFPQTRIKGFIMESGETLEAGAVRLKMPSPSELEASVLRARQTKGGAREISFAGERSTREVQKVEEKRGGVTHVYADIFKVKGRIHRAEIVENIGGVDVLQGVEMRSGKITKTPVEEIYRTHYEEIVPIKPEYSLASGMTLPSFDFIPIEDVSVPLRNVKVRRWEVTRNYRAPFVNFPGGVSPSFSLDLRPKLGGGTREGGGTEVTPGEVTGTEEGTGTVQEAGTGEVPETPLENIFDIPLEDVTPKRGQLRKTGERTQEISLAVPVQAEASAKKLELKKPKPRAKPLYDFRLFREERRGKRRGRFRFTEIVHPVMDPLRFLGIKRSSPKRRSGKRKKKGGGRKNERKKKVKKKKR